VREIVGLDAELLRVWSSRRADIEPALAALRLQFQADHGRPPTSVEAQKLAQQATLDAREGKHAPRSLAEQRASWRPEATDVLGAENLNLILRRVLTTQRRPTSPLPDAAAIATDVLATIQAERATWQCNPVRCSAYARKISPSTGPRYSAGDSVEFTRSSSAADHSVRGTRASSSDFMFPIPG
jgi:TrwC relaxase